RLDASRVPERLRKWITLAQRWGHSDDGMRSEVVDGATPEELDELLTLLDADKSDWDTLHAWLAGAEAKAPPTEEYVAFTCLTMALDLAEVRRKQIGWRGGELAASSVQGNPVSSGEYTMEFAVHSQ